MKVMRESREMKVKGRSLLFVSGLGNISIRVSIGRLWGVFFQIPIESPDKYVVRESFVG